MCRSAGYSVGLINPRSWFRSLSWLCISMIFDTVAEWLRQPTRNWLEYVRVDSSPASVEAVASYTPTSSLSPFRTPKNRLYTFWHLHTQKYCYQISRSYICTYSLFGDRKTYFLPYVLQCSFHYLHVTIMGTLFILS